MNIRIRNLICAGTLALAVAAAGVPAFASTAGNRVAEMLKPSARALSAEPGLHVEGESGYVYGKGSQRYMVSLADTDGCDAVRIELPDEFKCSSVNPGVWTVADGDGEKDASTLCIADASGTVLCEIDVSAGETDVDAEGWGVIYVTADGGSLIDGIESFSLSGDLDMTVSETGDSSARFDAKDNNAPACLTVECMDGDDAILSESAYTGRDYFFTGDFEADAPGYVFFGREGTVSLSGMEAWGATESFAEAFAEIAFDTPVEVTGISLPDISGADVTVTAETSAGDEVAVKNGFSGLQDVVRLSVEISEVTEADFYACTGQTCLGGSDKYPIYGFATGNEAIMDAHLEAGGAGDADGGTDDGDQDAGDGAGGGGEDSDGADADTGGDGGGRDESGSGGDAAGAENVTLPGFAQSGDMTVTIKNTYSDGAQVGVSGRLTVKYKAGGSTKTKDSRLDGGDMTFVRCLHEETVVDAGYEATCTEAGRTDGASCALCGEVLAEGAEIPALGHDYYLTLDEPASCEEPGRRVYGCSRCDSGYDEEIPATGHSYLERTVDATCTEDGYVLHTCSRCGNQYTDDETGALGHDWSRARTEPTCTDAGSVYYSCSRCGESRTETLDATGHDYADTTIGPTCTEDGYTVHVCANCGDSYTDGVTPAVGHSWTERAVEPTCTSSGSVTYTCSECGESRVETVAGLGHDYESSVTQPSCTEGGYTTHTCKRCGYSYNDDATKALGHDYDAVVTAPTYASGGYTTYTCTRCGYSYTGGYTDALPPAIVVPDTEASTEGSSGSSGSSSSMDGSGSSDAGSGSSGNASLGDASSGSASSSSSGSASSENASSGSASSGNPSESASSGSASSESTSAEDGSSESGSAGGTSENGSSSGEASGGGGSSDASEKIFSASETPDTTTLALEASSSSGSASVSGLVSSAATGSSYSGGASSVVTWERQSDGSMLLSNGDAVSAEGVVTTADGTVLSGSDAGRYLTDIVGEQASSWLLRNSDDGSSSSVITTTSSGSSASGGSGAGSGSRSVLTLSDSVVGVSDDGTVYLEGGTEVAGDGTVVLVDGTVLEGEEAEDYLTDTFGEEAAELLQPDSGQTSLRDDGDDGDASSEDEEFQEDDGDAEEAEEKIPFYKNLTFWIIVVAALIGVFIVRRHWRRNHV